MGLFGSSESNVRYGAIIDIGSGSVLSAIVKSDMDKEHPEIIWSKREYVLIKDTVSLEQSAKNVMTAFMNCILLLDGEGQRKLQETERGAQIQLLQVSISAPWSYTITKTVSFKDEETFEITKTLINELTEAAQKKTLEKLKESDIATSLGLEIITRTTTDIIANDYRSEEPYGQMVKKLSLAHVSVVAQQYLTDAIKETREKILPKATLEKYSFMLIYYFVMREMYPTTTEFCLVDVTFEATEIGIVREGILRYSTHMSFGSYALSREISAILKIPKEEAYSFMKNPIYEKNINSLPQGKKENLQKMFTSYQKRVTELFTQTGDTLSIPKMIFLHADLYTEVFFTKLIDGAATTATKGSHMIHQVTNELLTKHFTPEEKKAVKMGSNDTSLLLTVQFFHKRHHCKEFEQL